MISPVQLTRRSGLMAALVIVSPLLLGQAEPVRIVALGASNTSGWGVATPESYPAQLQALLAANGVPAVVVNAGIPGDTTSGMLARLESLIEADTRLVILQPGTNDARAGLDAAQSEANVREIGRRLAHRDVKLVVIDSAVLASVPSSEMQDDGIHYTARGYGILADRLLPRVLAVLGK